MSATASKRAMRGVPSEAPAEKPGPSGEIDDVLTEHDQELEDDETSEEGDGEVPATAVDEQEPIPEFVDEETNGDWVYHIQHGFEELRGAEKVKKNDIAKGIKKIRVPAVLYARNMRDMMQSDDDSMTRQIFNLCCSMTRVPASVLERLDHRDYTTVAKLVRKRLEGEGYRPREESAPTSDGR
jgi:hypothetical protein